MARYIEKRRRKWYAILDVPKDVRNAIGKPRLVKSLDTDSEVTALRRAAPLVAQWKGEIEAARKGTRDPVEADIRYWRKALADVKGDPEGEDTVKSLIIDHYADKMEEMEPGSGVRFFRRATGDHVDTTEHLDAWISIIDDTPKTKDMKRADVERLATQFPILQDITKREVSRWAASLIEDGGLQRKTVQRILSACRGYWNFLQNLEAVSEDVRPFDRLEVGKVGRKYAPAARRLPFKPEEVVQLLNASVERTDNQLADLICLGMWSGARIEELCSLKVEKVSDNSFTVEDAKTQSGWREVPIHSKLKPIIDRLLDESSDGYVLSGLTTNKYGDRSNAVGKRFGRLKKDLGYDRRHVFHSIRRTVVGLLQDAGVPENDAADIVGHDKPTMTFGLYGKTGELEALRTALEKIDYPG